MNVCESVSLMLHAPNPLVNEGDLCIVPYAWECLMLSLHERPAALLYTFFSRTSCGQL